MLQTLQDLAGEVPGLIGDRVRLLALEVEQAARALARMMALAVVAALMLATAWLALWTGLAWAAIQAGLPWGLAVAAAIVINTLAALLALRQARHLSRFVALPATVRQLTSNDDPCETAEEELRAATTAAASLAK